MIKLTIIGAGSTVFTKKIVTDLLTLDRFKSMNIALMDIEHRMLDKSSNVSRLVDKLISKDLVNRSVSSKDRRRIEIVITSRGISVLNEIDVILTDMNSKIKAIISDDNAKQTNRILDQLREIAQYY